VVEKNLRLPTPVYSKDLTVPAKRRMIYPKEKRI
jgi:hypothetical protein